MRELLVVCEELPPPKWVHSILSEVEHLELVLADCNTVFERLNAWKPDVALVLVRNLTSEWDLLLDRFLEHGISACVFTLEPRRDIMSRPQLHVVQ